MDYATLVGGLCTFPMLGYIAYIEAKVAYETRHNIGKDNLKEGGLEISMSAVSENLTGLDLNISK